ncbi:MAG: glycoside hydrolase family 42 [Thermofilaceae archaeon]|nr:glycoside hydrolase family 42 [Thermofilaceae archaeon]MCX8179923.1 glycoside hydrolase family 42 [Thermofilaceae archaeon]MDW8004386.1 glycoside hydrolase family 42 [Thermofilaceae archaeon]
MKTERVGSFIMVDRTFHFLLGVNYWPRRLNIRMWRDWDEEAVRLDVRQMKELGVRVARVFIKCEDFADEQGNLRDSAARKLACFLDILAENGLGAFITFIVGHMSGKNWAVPWASFEDLYKPESVERTMRFVESVVERFKGHPALAGWILSNELSLVKRAANRGEALQLLRSFAYSVRRLDPNHVLSSGDVPDSFMQETPNVKDIVDYVGPHLYLYDSDEVRHGYTYSAMLELYSCGGKLPVILEEFGFSTLQYSEESHARFINEILYTALAHEASGAFLWCFSDFPDESDPPYEWRPLELAFGLVRKDGSLKPAGGVYSRFASELSTLEKLGVHAKYKRVTSAAVVAPFYLFRDYEFVWYKQAVGFDGLTRLVCAGYAGLAAASLQAKIVYELDVENAFNWAKLLTLPSTVAALASTWRKLLDYVEKGGFIYTSFIRGYGGFKALHDSPTHLWAELFGVENTLEAGNIGRKVAGSLEINFEKDLDPLRRGDTLKLTLPEPVWVFTAKPVDAEVIAVDGSGQPVIFASKRGRGKAFLSLIPFEAIVARQEKVEWMFCKLYEGLANAAGLERPYVSSDPRVEVSAFASESSDLVFTVNHSSEVLEATLKTEKLVKEVKKLGGDAELKNFRNGVSLSMPGKSAAILLVQR